MQSCNIITQLQEINPELRDIKGWNYSHSLSENSASVNSSSAGVFLPGVVELFKPVLSSLHVKNGPSIERLEKLVNRRLRRKRFRKRAVDRPMQRLQHWSDETSEEEPLNLPSILEESHLNLLADRIARIILRFHKHCTSNALWQMKPVHTALKNTLHWFEFDTVSPAL